MKKKRKGNMVDGTWSVMWLLDDIPKAEKEVAV